MLFQIVIYFCKNNNRIVQPTTYRSTISFLLALLVMNATVLKEAHHLLDHHHEEAAHCESSGSETHLHSEEYAHVDCFICFFNFSPAEFYAEFGEIKNQAAEQFTSGFYYKNPFYKIAFRQMPTRGPPSLSA